MPQLSLLALVASAFAVLVSFSAHAQTLTIYDDALQNTFQDWSGCRQREAPPAKPR